MAHEEFLAAVEHLANLESQFRQVAAVWRDAQAAWHVDPTTGVQAIKDACGDWIRYLYREIEQVRFALYADA